MTTMIEAEASLSELVARVESGEEIVLTRGNKPIAKLVPLGASKSKPTFGALKGQLDLPDGFFFDPLPDEELARWEAGQEVTAR